MDRQHAQAMPDMMTSLSAQDALANVPAGFGLAPGCPLGRHPGPSTTDRIDVVVGRSRTMTFELAPGENFRDAVAGPLAAAGIRCATVRVEGLRLSRMRYVRPALATDGHHAAFYSDTFESKGPIEILIATATVGERDGQPFVHCHAVWDEGGEAHGGHLHVEHCVVGAAATVTAWGLADTTMRADYDAETDFTLFHPVAHQAGQLADQLADHPVAEGPRLAVARIRPNVDLLTSIEALCLRVGFKTGLIRGSVGSVVGARFVGGGEVRDIATEIVVVGGRVATRQGQPQAELSVALIDIQGRVHRGHLQRGTNPVLICFELFVEECAA